MNTGAEGGSAEWLRFVMLRAQTEALGAMAKKKHPRLKLLERNQIW